MSKFGSPPYYASTLRRFVWRLGRKLYCWARNDLTRGPETNGEYELLDYFLLQAPKAVTLVDIGANKGEWTKEALAKARRIQVDAQIHAFEPSNDSFKRLQGLFQSEPIVLNNLAVSNTNGDACLFVRGELCGINSLYEADGGKREQVQTIQLDEYAAHHGIARIDFVKSDTEGHDFFVMQGAANLLTAGNVKIWQFEYNHRWIDARCYLKDVFEFISDKPYLIGKLSNRGVEIYQAWHPELERYFETNFVLIQKEWKQIESISTVSHFNPCNVPTAENEPPPTTCS